MHYQKPSFVFGHTFPKLSQKQKIIGVVLGLLSAFALYAFSWVALEALRVVSVSWSFDLMVFTPAEMQFYNWFLAAVALIFGQSVSLVYWLKIAKRPFQKRNHRHISILHDQWVLMAYFINWFSRVAFAYLLIFGFLRVYYTFSFYKEYRYIFILIVLVLFLQSWTTLRLVYKRKSLKWMSFSFLSIGVLSYLFSFINFSDYKETNRTILAKNIRYAYAIQLPKSDAYEKNRNGGVVVYVAKDSLDSNKCIPVVNGKAYTMSQLRDGVLEEAMYRGFETKITLAIDKQLSMKKVQQIHSLFTEKGYTNLYYAVITNTTEYNPLYYQDLVLEGPKFTDTVAIGNDTAVTSKLTIELTNEGTYRANGRNTNITELKKILTVIIQPKKAYEIEYHVAEQASFENYVKVVEAVNEVLLFQREQLSQEIYGWPYERLYMRRNAEQEITDCLPYAFTVKMK